ncbi:MAG: ABC transporter substrate-binding protein [Verrucomicrobiota bacterium]
MFVTHRAGGRGCTAAGRSAFMPLVGHGVYTWLAMLVAIVFLAGGLRAEEARLIIITPHSGPIRFEFERGFSRWHKARYGTAVAVEWRDVGGTTDALKFVQSEFARKPDGIGMDCFFGGGVEPYLLLMDKKMTLSYRPAAESLQGVPEKLHGLDIYDPQFNWYAAALSSFGILQNTRLQEISHLPLVRRWEDLSQPKLFGLVGAGDPRNSGTMNSMFEAFLQAFGWDKGWNVLARIGGNVRKFDRLSPTTAKDVTMGETVYGFAIDFYGFTQVAMAGRTNMTFVLPDDFTAINPDGICLLKGAPNAVTAQRFIDFILSEEGQRLWFLPCGHPLGPTRYSIERMSIRPDFYARYKKVSNIEFSPFDLKQNFRYDNKLARDRRDVVSALVGTLLVDTHGELSAAWKAVIARGLRPEDLAELGTVPITADEALKLAKGKFKEPAFRNVKLIEWQTWAQQKYRRLAAR